jgi:hypothetical protein
MTTTTRRSLLGLIFAVALLFPSKPSRADAPPANALAGTFRYAGTANEEIGRKVAIDKAIDSLFFAIRPIARSRLSNGTKIDPSVTFAFDAGKIRVKVPSAPEAISPDNGSPVDFTSDGEKSKLTQKQSGQKLTQIFQAEEGRRQNDWQLSADNSTLTLRVTISSPKLSTPCVYTLTYKRS